jgi:hypothetical protein
MEVRCCNGGISVAVCTPAASLVGRVGVIGVGEVAVVDDLEREDEETEEGEGEDSTK